MATPWIAHRRVGTFIRYQRHSVQQRNGRSGLVALELHLGKPEEIGRFQMPVADFPFIKKFENRTGAVFIIIPSQCQSYFL